MPERIAKTDAFQQITEAIGSGPFKFVKEEWVPGQQGGLRQEHRLRAAQGAAVLGLGRQGRQGRPRRVDLHPGYRHRGGGAQCRRGRLVRAAAARPPAGASPPTRTSSSRRRSARHRWACCASTTLLPPFNNPKMRAGGAVRWSTRRTTCTASPATRRTGRRATAIFICGGTAVRDAMPAPSPAEGQARLRQGEGS